MQVPPPVLGATSSNGAYPPDNNNNNEPQQQQRRNTRRNGLTTSAVDGSSSRRVPAEYVAETKLPTDIGQFQLRAYRVPGAPLGQEPCVIYSRDKPPFGKSHVPVRIHDQCLTSEVFRSQR
jgi:hypothetical protein